MHVCTALHSKTSPIGSAALGTVKPAHPNPAPTAPSASGCWSRLPFTTLDPVAPFPDKLRAIKATGAPTRYRPWEDPRCTCGSTPTEPLAGRSRTPSSCTGSTWTLSTRDFATTRIRPGMGCRRIAQYAAGGTRIERRATCRTKPDRVVSEITGDLDGDLAAWLPLRRNRSRRSPATSRLRSRLRFPQMRAGLV